MTTSNKEFSQRRETGGSPDLQAIYNRSNLTRLQILYWTAQILRPSDPFLSSTLTFTIRGPVETPRLQRAFQAVLAQSDALRTVIHEVDGVPQSRVRPASAELDETAMAFLDFSQEEDSKATYARWLQERAAAALDMTVQLFESALVRLGPEHFVWYLKQHHIIADASSSILIFGQVAKLYEQAGTSDAVKGSPRPPFADYVAYERDYRQSAQYQKSAAYWQQELSSVTETTGFVGGARKESTQVHRETCDLGIERSQRLRQVARQKGIFIASEDLSLYNIFLTLFFIQLYHLSGKRRLGLLTPVHNRVTPTFKKTIGLLMELCPVQVEVAQDDTFLSLLAKVKRKTRAAMLHYQVGSGLALSGRAFDVMFNMHQMPPIALGGIPVQPQRMHSGHGTESLVLHVVDRGLDASFKLHFDFHEELFTEAEHKDNAQAFLRLVDAFLDDYTRPVHSAGALFAIPSSALRPDGNSKALPDASGATNVERPGPTRNQTHAEWYRSLVARRDPLELQLTQIWEEVLGVRPIDVTDNFFDLGGSSLLAVQLFAEIENLTGKNMSLSTLLQAGTIEEQARLLRQEGWSSSWSSLVPLQPRGTRTPFFCVHGGGGNVIHYRVLAHHLGSDQPFYGLQPRGMDGKEPFHTSVEEMAAFYIEEIQSVQPDGPYFLGGYCFGATVAFEMAHQLQRQGVALLVSLDGATHDYPDLLPDATERASRHLRRLLSAHPREAFRYVMDRMAQRSARFWKRTKKRLRKQKLARKLFPGLGKPLPHPPHHHRMVLTLRRANRQYEPQVYPGKLILFRGRGKHEHTLGWDRLFRDGVEVHELDISNSMEMFKEPQVEVLAGKLRGCLDDANDHSPADQKASEEAEA